VTETIQLRACVQPVRVLRASVMKIITTLTCLAVVAIDLTIFLISHNIFYSWGGLMIALGALAALSAKPPKR